MTQQSAWQQAKNILCIRLDTIGDVLMTTPAIRALKEGAPDRKITLLTSPAGVEIASLIPELEQILIYDAPWMKATAPRENCRPEYAMIEELRQGQFDAAVIFTVYSQNPLPSAMLCYLAGIPLRLAHCHENPYQLLTDWVLDPEPQRGVRHEVQRQLDLVATIGCAPQDLRMSLRVPQFARQAIQPLLQRLGLDLNKFWVVIHPGATAASRRYPPEKFAQVAQLLAQQWGCQILWTGTGAEQELIAQIQAEMQIPSHSLAGQLSLSELAALIEAAPLLISNNTGPVHMAASVGTPVVDLYALTNPQHTPWAVPHRVLYHDVPCRFCYKSICPQGHHHCLELVTPESVVQAAAELLQQGRSPLPLPTTPLPYQPISPPLRLVSVPQFA